MESKHSFFLYMDRGNMIALERNGQMSASEVATKHQSCDSILKELPQTDLKMKVKQVCFYGSFTTLLLI